MARVIQQRLTVRIGLLLPGPEQVRLRTLADGLFGVGFAAVESWTSHRELTEEQLVEALSTVIQGGIDAAGALPT